MAWTSSGELTLGQCVPLAAQMQAELDVSVAAALPEVAARVTGLLQAQASITVAPPTILGSIALLGTAVASLQAAVALPSASLNLTAIATLLATLQATLADLQAAAAFSLSLPLGTPGVFAYRYTGQVGAAGTGLQSEIGGGLPGGSAADNAVAVLLIATDGGAQAALDAMFVS